MKTLTRITLHPSLRNEYRPEVEEWCLENLGKHCRDYGDWCLSSNYDKHGCFDVVIDPASKHESAITAFLLKYPDTIVIDAEYQYTLETPAEVAALFEEV